MCGEVVIYLLHSVVLWFFEKHLMQFTETLSFFNFCIISRSFSVKGERLRFVFVISCLFPYLSLDLE